jgi:hypothetical protein
VLSKPDFFMSFNIDKNWLYSDKFRIHTFFDARLSALPVHNQETPPPTGGGGSTGSGSSTQPTTSTTSTGCTGSSALTFSDPNTFWCSQKVATLIVGTYWPYQIALWRHEGRPNNLFIARVGRIGFSTPTGDSANAAINSNRFYTQFAFGARFGHTESLERFDSCCGRIVLDKNSSPELISYLDVTVGKFGNFLEVPNPGVPRPPGTDLPTRSYRAWRASFEGILHIPKTPLIVGFNANIHLQGSKPYYPIRQTICGFCLGHGSMLESCSPNYYHSALGVLMARTEPTLVCPLACYSSGSDTSTDT